MSTSSIYRYSEAAETNTGNAVGIGVDSDDERLYVNVTGTRQAISPERVIVTDAATLTLTAQQAGATVIATKTSATQVFTLPTAASVPAAEFKFVSASAGGEVSVNPNDADTILIKATEDAGTSIAPAAGVAVKNTAATNVVGDHIALISDGVSKWYMVGQSGIWAEGA